MSSRPLLLAGFAAVLASYFLPWLTVSMLFSSKGISGFAAAAQAFQKLKGAQALGAFLLATLPGAGGVYGLSSLLRGKLASQRVYLVTSGGPLALWGFVFVAIVTRMAMEKSFLKKLAFDFGKRLSLGMLGPGVYVCALGMALALAGAFALRRSDKA
ncbi:MAG: hypothetical protein AB1405_12095 [Bdellovibrionota bacterium]